jgi:ribosomal protein L5
MAVGNNTMEKARLDELYTSQLRQNLQKNLGLKNINEVPKITKIVLNVGVASSYGYYTKNFRTSSG